MQVEKQCCTLEQAKRLKELGVEQTSCFDWYIAAFTTDNETYGEGPEIAYSCEFLPDDGENEYSEGVVLYVPGTEQYSAFTVAELGEMIGKGTKAEKNYWLWLNGCVHSVCSPTIAYNAVALAGFVITQIEEGNLTIEEINTRLMAG